MKILLVYPNLPLMMSPAMSMAIFNSIAKSEGCEARLFETTMYSDQYSNRHIRLTEIGAARQNNESDIKDMFYIKPRDEIIPDFVKCVTDYNPDLILVSVQEDVWKVTTLLMDAIAEKDIPHIIGGVFPTNAPNLVLSHPSINVIARHEGENIVRDAIRAIKSGGDLSGVRGLWLKINGKIKCNPPQELCNVGDITPDYSCFDNIRWSRPMGGKIFRRAVSMETFRGCPYNCTYCNSPTTRDLSSSLGLGKFMRKKSVDEVERDLNYYLEKINPDLVMFQDDSFLARSKKDVFDFCNMWSKYKIPFWFNTRIENCHPEYLSALKEAGVYRMSFGLESGNEEYRSKILDRKCNNQEYEKFIRYINESNIPYSLNVIIGMPFETRDMVLDTAHMVHAARGYDGLTISMFQPYWGTKLRILAVENGFLSNDYINGYDSKFGGGYLDTWALKMPEPYLQSDDVYKLIKTFALYAHFGPQKWDQIRESESDEDLYKKLFAQYQQEFFGDTQMGGMDRVKKFCTSHDATSTYNFTAV